MSTKAQRREALKAARKAVSAWVRTQESDAWFPPKDQVLVELAERLKGVSPPPGASVKARLLALGHLVRGKRSALYKPREGEGQSSPKRKKVAMNSAEKRRKFYQSMEWKRARYTALKASEGRCVLCGGSPAAFPGLTLNVDHIQPLSERWDLRLDQSNLQVLCGSCNAGKGAWDDTDWRQPQ